MVHNSVVTIIGNIIGRISINGDNNNGDKQTLKSHHWLKFLQTYMFWLKGILGKIKSTRKTIKLPYVLVKFIYKCLLYYPNQSVLLISIRKLFNGTSFMNFKLKKLCLVWRCSLLACKAEQSLKRLCIDSFSCARLLHISFLSSNFSVNSYNKTWKIRGLKKYIVYWILLNSSFSLNRIFILIRGILCCLSIIDEVLLNQPRVLDTSCIEILMRNHVVKSI